MTLAATVKVRRFIKVFPFMIIPPNHYASAEDLFVTAKDFFVPIVHAYIAVGF